MFGTGLGTGPGPEIELGPDAGPDAGPDPRPKRDPIAVGLTAGSIPEPWPIVESGGNEGGGYLGPLVL